MKGPNLRHHRACSQNKGLSRASWQRTGPSPTGDRKVRAARAGRGQSAPQRHPLPNSKQTSPLTKTSWDSGRSIFAREGHSQRPAPQNRHAAHLRRRACYTPRKPSGRDGGGDKPQPQLGETTLAKHLVT